MKKMLIAYYTWANGNTKRIAEELQKATGADIERISKVEPYPSDYEDTDEQAHIEIVRGIRPDIIPLNLDPEDYDVIALGTPTWWYTLSPPMKTFIYEHDWSGKTIIPFTTCSGWPGKVFKNIQKSCLKSEDKDKNNKPKPKPVFVYKCVVKFDKSGGPNLVTPQADIDKWTASVKAFLEDESK